MRMADDIMPTAKVNTPWYIAFHPCSSSVANLYFSVAKR